LHRILIGVPAFNLVARAKTFAPLVPSSPVLAVLNGTAVASGAMNGFSVGSMKDVLSGDKLCEVLGPVDAADAIGAINLTFFVDGLSIEIEGAELKVPIEIQNIHAGGQTHSRHQVNVREGAKAMIAERQSGTGEAFVSSVSHTDIGARANVLWIIIQEQQTIQRISGSLMPRSKSPQNSVY
jgi:Fe-S cluster assembly protein SufD